MRGMVEMDRPRESIPRDDVPLNLWGRGLPPALSVLSLNTDSARKSNRQGRRHRRRRLIARRHQRVDVSFY